MKGQKGYWIKITHLFDDDEYQCSVCGSVFNKKFPVCPECGFSLKYVKSDPMWVDEMELFDSIFED